MHPVRLATLACALTLAACAAAPSAPPPQSQPNVPAAAAVISAAVLPPQGLAKLQQTCDAAAPLIGAATLPVAPSVVSDTAAFAASYCEQLKAAPAGTVPATTDPTTPTWLPKVIAGVQIAGAIARYALPVILPLL